MVLSRSRPGAEKATQGVKVPRKADKDLEGRIVEAAYELWRRGGEHALTMRAVAKAAKTTTPTVYERFRDKHDLLVLLRARARNLLFANLEPAKSAVDICQLLLDFALTHENEYLLITSDWAERYTRKELTPNLELLKEKLAGELKGSPQEYTWLARALVALVHGSAILLFNEAVDAQMSKELAETTVLACQTLIEGVRCGYDKKVKNKSLASR